MISLLIPTYRNPSYLDSCLKSAVEGRASVDTEIIVIVDGFVEESREVIDKYKDNVLFLEFDENYGMQTALNYGAYNANGRVLLIINDDNILQKGWDSCKHHCVDSQVVTINQVEPTGPGIFKFPVKDFGRTPEEFDNDKFQEYCLEICADPKDDTTWFTDDGGIFPFMVTKKDYMTVGGFDTAYQSPFICDWDFFLKLELAGCTFLRTTLLHFYHFGSAATKNRTDDDQIKFKESEQPAADMFAYKWGFPPSLFENNSHRPKGHTFKGIEY